MTQNTPVSKTDESIKNRRAFLRALYSSAPDDLYLELRCIHPQTGEVRTLWGRMGDKRGLGAALKHADKLNGEGYGVYFAPCLRREKKGSADAAAWVPALWMGASRNGGKAGKIGQGEKIVLERVPDARGKRGIAPTLGSRRCDSPEHGADG